jgi:hypothetical protein
MGCRRALNFPASSHRRSVGALTPKRRADSWMVMMFWLLAISVASLGPATCAQVPK